MSDILTLPGEVLSSRKVRAEAAKHNMLLFANLYLPHHIAGYEMAQMHRQMYMLAQDPSLRFSVVMAFRGSGKSTILGLIYPIWSIIGFQQKRFVLLVSQTQPQAKQLFANIRKELESNVRLQAELGPFESFEDEWGNSGIILTRYGARIMPASVDQSIRGIKHGAFRPDLIIMDDVEDVQAVRTDESRDKTYRWFTGEILPLGDMATKFVLIGNKLHEESLVMRVAESIREGERPGVVLEYPIVDGKGRPYWPGKYPDQASIEAQEKEVGDPVAYRREYMLEIIDNADPVVRKEWIHYYDELPGEGYKYQRIMSATGVDLAIAQSASADYTAMVSAHVYKIDKKRQIFILPHPINEKIDSPTQLERAKMVSKSVGNGSRSPLYIEEVGYQLSLIQHLVQDGYPATGFKPHGQDKRARLALTAPQLQNATVLFPRQGCEDLIKQLLAFPTAKHDDLVDAFAILILKILEDIEKQGPSVRIEKARFWDQMARRAGNGNPADWARHRRTGRHNIATMSDEEFFGRSSGITIR